MKKLLLIACLMALTYTASAQTLRFAHFSYETVLAAMPDYSAAQQRLQTLRQQYDAESRRMADEFNNKYEDFLEAYHTLAPSILNKRQAELQELMQRGTAFREEAQQQLKQAEEEQMKPVRERLDRAVQQLGRQRAYAFILNTDGQSVPYVDATLGDDITDTLKGLLH